MALSAEIGSLKKMASRLFLSSGDLVADRRYEFARDLQLKGDLPAAAELLEQAIELVPKFPSAWYTLGKIRLQLGQRDAAIAAFRAARDADPEDRHGAGLHLMQLGVEAVGSMPPGYVQTLFDQYAPRFEAALVGDLGYRGPALLFKAVLSVRAPDPDWLHAICESVDEHLAHHAPGTPAPPLVQPALPPGTAFGRAMRYQGAVGSTQDEIRAWADDPHAPAPHGAVVVAERQTAGRGRQGRAWSSPSGCARW